jgi:hypothetical protein
MNVPSETELSRPKSSEARPPRDSALDFTKGLLVLCMITYHTLNYFLRDHGGPLLKYLRFLPPSFIMITGFILTAVYLAKYRTDDLRLYLRLMARGFKLLGIFLLLNLVATLLMSKKHPGTESGLGAFLSNLPDILFVGGNKLAAFEVLVPISYLLIFGGLLLWAHSYWRWTIHLLFVAGLVGEYFLERSGDENSILAFATFGLLGMLCGLRARDKMGRWTVPLGLVLAGYLAYVAALTFWHENYFLEYAGVCVTLALFYGIGRSVGDRRFAPRIVILCGQYSLVAYIVQIMALQVLLRAERRLPWRHGRIALGFFLTVFLTVAVVELIHASRKKSKLMDDAYRAVFA